MRISDILDCIEKIERYTRGYYFSDFQEDPKTIDSVLRNLGIIGEAASHVPRDVILRYPHLPWAEMRRMRNIVIHEYHGVNLEIIWQTVQENLPPMVEPLRQILDNE
jgi:uncharacterized protein with HEPN domain